MILYTILHILHELHKCHLLTDIFTDNHAIAAAHGRYLRQRRRRCCIIIQSSFRMYLQRRVWAKRLALHK